MLVLLAGKIPLYLYILTDGDWFHYLWTNNQKIRKTSMSDEISTTQFQNRKKKTQLYRILWSLDNPKVNYISYRLFEPPRDAQNFPLSLTIILKYNSLLLNIMKDLATENTIISGSQINLWIHKYLYK